MSSLVRNDKLILRKFYSYLISGIIIVFALQFGSLMDGIVLGNMFNENALSASSLCLPAIYLIEFPAFALSTGAPILISMLLGKRNVEKAKKVMSFSLLFGFLISLIFIPLGIFLSDQIASVLAGNFQELVPLMSPYVKAFLLQAPIISLGMIFAGILAADNNPKLAAAYYIICNVVHIGAEVIFLVILKDNMRMFGAGISLGIGMVVGFIVVIPYLLSKKRTLSFSFRKMGVKEYFVDLVKASSPAGLNILCLFGMTLVLNIANTMYLQNINDLVIYAMLANSVFIVDLMILGILQLLPTVVGTLFGEQDYFSIRSICRRIIIIGEIISLVLLAIVAAFPQLFFYIFGVSLDGIDEMHLLVIRIYSFSFIFYFLNKFVLNYYPSIGYNAVTYVNLIVRNIVVGAPLLFVLIMCNGIMGFAYGSIIVEAVSVILSYIFLLIDSKCRPHKGKPILMLPKSEEYVNVLDASFTGEVNEVIDKLDELRKELLESKIISENTIALISLTIEEITTNMNKFSKGSNHKPSLIDISIKKKSDKIILRIRDNNVNFNPTYVGDDEYGLDGITMLEKVSSSVTYLRLLNLNNTIVEFEI